MATTRRDAPAGLASSPAGAAAPATGHASGATTTGAPATATAPALARKPASTWRVVAALLAAPWLASLIGACAALSGGASRDAVEGAWRIDQAQREPILDRSRARIVFGADGQMTGDTSCGPMRASYSLKEHALKLGPVSSERNGPCRQLGLEQEDRILTGLEQAVSARVRPDDGLLELRDAEGRGVLRASRVEAPPLKTLRDARTPQRPRPQSSNTTPATTTPLATHSAVVTTSPPNPTPSSSAITGLTKQ